jgi:hypothetical protein
VGSCGSTTCPFGSHIVGLSSPHSQAAIPALLLCPPSLKVSPRSAGPPLFSFLPASLPGYRPTQRGLWVEAEQAMACQIACRSAWDAQAHAALVEKLMAASSLTGKTKNRSRMRLSAPTLVVVVMLFITGAASVAALHSGEAPPERTCIPLCPRSPRFKKF